MTWPIPGKMWCAFSFDCKSSEEKSSNLSWLRPAGNLQTSLREEDSSPSVSLVDIFFKAKELERKGHDVIQFDAGEPDFAPPEEVVSATTDAIRSGKAHYTEAGGIPEVRKAISEHLSKKHGVEVTPKQVLVTAGGRLALFYAFFSISKKKGKVGIITPDWPAYRDNAKFLSLPMQFFRANPERQWELDVDEIKKSDCTSIILNYPNNPTGKILSLKTMNEIVDIAREKNLTILSDEVYSDYILNNASEFRSILEYPEVDSLFVTSLSKSYAMTGYRAAYMVSNESAISNLSKVNGLLLTSAPEFVQHGMIAALRCDHYVKDKVELMRRRREVAVKSFRKYVEAEFYEPDGAMYLFPRLKIQKGQFNAERFSLELLEKEHVSVTPGTSFGSTFKEHIRITLLQSESRIEEGIRRIGKLLI